MKHRKRNRKPGLFLSAIVVPERYGVFYQDLKSKKWHRYATIFETEEGAQRRLDEIVSWEPPIKHSLVCRLGKWETAVLLGLVKLENVLAYINGRL